MKTSITTIAKLVGGAALLAATGMASAATNGVLSLGGAGITSTLHNLSGSISGANGNDEICVFCHTPHGGDQTAFAPLWNRQTTTVDGATGYTRFQSLNRWSYTSADAPVGSVSIACLSCHDGTQARSAIINTPGSASTSNISMVEFQAMSELSGATHNGAPDGSMNSGSRHTAGGDFIYIGTDLSNDHPISMQYGGGGITTANCAPTDPDFVDHNGNATCDATVAGTYGGQASGTGVLSYDTNGPSGATDRWWIDTGTTGRQLTDFPLFTRTFAAGSGVPEPTVECATCHEPHSANSTFLRLPGGNVGSQVCLTCHAK